jgi:hypothetical protein
MANKKQPKVITDKEFEQMMEAIGQNSDDESKHSPNWGGAREGAGRPKKAEGKKKTYSFTLPQELVEELEIRASVQGLSRSEALAQLLAETFCERP